MAFGIGALILLFSSIGSARIEGIKMRGPMAAGAFALMDTIGLAICLGACGSIHSYGALLALPGLWAVTRFSAPLWLSAPGAAGVLVAAASTFSPSGFSPENYPALLTILLSLGAASGGLIPRRREVPVAPALDETVLKEGSDDILELREAYRSLRDQYLLQDRKGRSGRMAKKVLEAAFTNQPWQQLADSLCTELNLPGLRIYATSLGGSRLIWQASAGVCRDAIDGPTPAPSTSVGSRALKVKVDAMVASLKRPDRDESSTSVVIRDNGRVCGLIVLDADSDSQLAAAEERLHPAHSLLGQTFVHLAKRDDEARRSREAEILYSVVSLARGAANQKVIAERIVKDLKEVLPADSVTICMLRPGAPGVLAQAGKGIEPLNLYSFPQGAGWKGWLNSGSPELLLLDPAEDLRVSQEDAFRARVRSVCVLPLISEDKTIGWLAATSSRSGAMDESHLTTLRITTCELGPALAASTQPKALVGSGLASPREFVQALKSIKDGVLVAVEVAAFDNLRRRFGAAALAQAVTRASRLLSAKAPPGSIICRKEEGSYVVLLRGLDQRQARSWANEVTASASVITLASPDGSSRLSLSLRAKVVDLTQDPEQPERPERKVKVAA